MPGSFSAAEVEFPNSNPVIAFRPAIEVDHEQAGEVDGPEVYEGRPKKRH